MLIGEVLQIENEGVWARYLSRERIHYGEGVKDKAGYWTSPHLSILAMGYNSKMVNSEEAHGGSGGLVCGGIFEKVPKLRVAFFECSAEWVVYWMHRMDDDYEWVKDGEASHLKMPPSEYIRRNCYVTCEVDEKLLPMAISELDEERVCLASDYPHHDSEFPHTIARIGERTDISNRQKELILGGNAARLLGLE